MFGWIGFGHRIKFRFYFGKNYHNFSNPTSFKSNRIKNSLCDYERTHVVDVYTLPKCHIYIWAFLEILNSDKAKSNDPVVDCLQLVCAAEWNSIKLCTGSNCRLAQQGRVKTMPMSPFWWKSGKSWCRWSEAMPGCIPGGASMEGSISCASPALFSWNGLGNKTVPWFPTNPGSMPLQGT